MQSDDVIVISESSPTAVEVELARQKLRQHGELASVLNFLNVISVLFIYFLEFPQMRLFSFLIILQFTCNSHLCLGMHEFIFPCLGKADWRKVKIFGINR